MTREETRILIQAGIKALGNQISFGSGRITEFNKDRAKEYPFTWLESLSVSTEVQPQGANMDDWEIVIHIAKKDQADSDPDQYEAIIDQCDYIAQQLIKQYNDLLSLAKLTTMSNISRDPFIKKHADITTGIILSFTLTSPDSTNVC